MRRKLTILIAVWAGAIGLGLHGLMTYKGTAGDAGAPPAIWPENKQLALSADKPVVVMFAHPRCPCTKASLGELAVLAARAPGKFEATVLFFEPSPESDAWSNTPLVQTARSIPGVRVLLDFEGRLARRFAAETSGHTLVYDPQGNLLFSGGITGSRGHLGDNAGLDLILEAIELSRASQQTAKVYGCGLFDPCATIPKTESN